MGWGRVEDGDGTIRRRDTGDSVRAHIHTHPRTGNSKTRENAQGDMLAPAPSKARPREVSLAACTRFPLPVLLLPSWLVEGDVVKVWRERGLYRSEYRLVLLSSAQVCVCHKVSFMHTSTPACAFAEGYQRKNKSKTCQYPRSPGFLASAVSGALEHIEPSFTSPVAASTGT
jgi:hypothetical protein